MTRLTAPKAALHPRSRHRDRYDFPALVRSYPELAPFVAPNAYGDLSVDFADPAAVKALNKALLRHVYGVQGWDIPPGYLCPPIPGRADYLHHLADLLAADNGGDIPRGPAVRALDIGVGANAIYPLLGHREYGWRFLGTDVDGAALASARRILDANPGLTEAIELRLQRSAQHIFRGVLQADARFEATLCNPPFHASAREAQEGTERKWRNLDRASAEQTWCPDPRRTPRGGQRGDAERAMASGRSPLSRQEPRLNFGGQGRELWCEGGEGAFVTRMIEESADFAEQCLWFTTLVSKSATLPRLRAALRNSRTVDTRILEMAQGQKKSRILAWTFLDAGERQEWLARRS